MGQQPSKKSRKGGKDKDRDAAAADAEASADAASADDTLQGSLSRATSANGGTSAKVGNGVDPSGAQSNHANHNGDQMAHAGSGLRPPGSQGIPSHSNHTLSPNDVSGSQSNSAVSPSTSPAHARKPPPLDIPATQTILSTPGSLTSGSAGSSMPMGESVSSAGMSLGKDKLKSFDIDDMIQRLLDVGYTGKVSKSLCLKNVEIASICHAAREVFLSQPTLIELSPPVKIVGDVHGQYSDLIRLFEMCGFPPAANYLFLGDYVDRGKQSLETILLLLCYKIKYPENFFLLRGNHECANVTRGMPPQTCASSLWLINLLLFYSRPCVVYGFYDECKRRCNIKTWKSFIDVFNCLPIAAIVASKIFCVHGGLSPSLQSMEDIKALQRPTDVPDYGLLNDLLWSDPSDTAVDWEDNERGVSYCFGKAIINDFLVRYDMDLICRAHMVVEDGYEFWNDRTLVTVFSAPNYCGGT